MWALVFPEVGVTFFLRLYPSEFYAPALLLLARFALEAPLLVVAEVALGFAQGRSTADALATRWVLWDRCTSLRLGVAEQQWDVVKAFDEVSRAKLESTCVEELLEFCLNLICQGPLARQAVDVH